ncbi:MAG: hypothetical protein R3A51_02700 [Nannocystaceae bacterium]
MYFTSDLVIDPSQLTELKKVKPTRSFARLFYYLTAGQVAEREEHETFTAVSILEQINTALRSVGVTNIIRLSRDDQDLYLDAVGRQDDLPEVMAAVASGAGAGEGATFSILRLVVERRDAALKHLIVVQVDRVHRPGVYPLRVTVHGLIRGLGEGEDEVRARLAAALATQERHDALVAERRALHLEFVAALAAALRQQIGVDDLEVTTRAQIIRPRRPVTAIAELHHADKPLFHGHVGVDAALFYAWLWAETCCARDLTCRAFTLVDESGRPILEVGETGFRAGQWATLNPEEPFEAPLAGDLRYFTGHDYERELVESGCVEAPPGTAPDEPVYTDPGAGDDD